jgi:hypothetical protein
MICRNWASAAIEAFRLKKRSAKVLVRDTAVELVEGKLLLAAKKKAKRAKSKLQRKNAAREAELIENAVHSIDDHRRLLKRQVTHQSFFSSAAGAWQYSFSHSSRLNSLGTSM